MNTNAVKDLLHQAFIEKCDRIDQRYFKIMCAAVLLHIDKDFEKVPYDKRIAILNALSAACGVDGIVFATDFGAVIERYMELHRAQNRQQ